jgi:hypothetical protein
MFEVISFFTDLQDGDHRYNVGDVYPRSGLAVTEERYKELASSNNKQHRPLIRYVADKVAENTVPVEEAVATEEAVEEQKQYTKTDISRMNAEETKLLAAELGIEVDEKSASDLKDEIKKALNL